MTLEIGTVTEGLQKLLSASGVQSSRMIGQTQSPSPHPLQKPVLAITDVSVSSTPYSSLAFAVVALKSSILRSCFRGGDFHRIKSVTSNSWKDQM